MSKLKKTYLVLTACIMGPLPARADNLLIWAPVKVSDQSYKATLGFRLPAEWETSAGADIGLAAHKDGALMPDSEQATLWGTITKVRVTPAARAQQDVGVRVDTLRGSGSLMLSRSRSWILSDSLDMQSTRSVNVSYDAVNAQQTSVNASQALKLIYPWTGTSLSAGAGMIDFKGDFSTSVAVNQRILPNLNLSAAVTDPLSSGQASNVSVNYQLRW